MKTIKNWASKEVLFKFNAKSLKKCLEVGVKKEANLQGADLQGANLDFSCWSFSCRSFNVKVSDRLVFQLFAHVSRIDYSKCSKKLRRRMDAFIKNNKELVNGFCRYRNDVKEI